MSTTISKTIAQERLGALDKLNPLPHSQSAESRTKVQFEATDGIELIGAPKDSDNNGHIKTIAASTKLHLTDLATINDSEVIEKGKKILRQAASNEAVVEASHLFLRNEVISTRFIVFSKQHEGFFDIEFSNGFDDEFILETLKEITSTFKQVVNNRPMCSTISLTSTEKFITIHGKESDSFIDVDLNRANFNMMLKRMIQEQRRTQVSVNKRRGG